MHSHTLFTAVTRYIPVTFKRAIKCAPLNVINGLLYFASSFTYTVWPEILAGRYFGGLLKICHLAEFTLAVEPA